MCAPDLRLAELLGSVWFSCPLCARVCEWAVRHRYSANITQWFVEVVNTVFAAAEWVSEPRYNATRDLVVQARVSVLSSAAHSG